MSKWHLIIDVARCENCCNCFLAIKDEYCGNSFSGYSAEQPRHGHRWLDIQQIERGSGSLMDVAYLPVTCNQCAEPSCLAAAENGAVHVREDGIVMIDPDRARGQRQLVDACPYGHIWYNEAEDLPQKWSFDAHLLDGGWSRPRPGQVCATGALEFLKISDEAMAARAEQEGLEVLHPEYGTRPRIWYRNLYRFRDAFIAGSVSEPGEQGRECSVAAEVTLLKGGAVVRKGVTNGFGDFKFDGLSCNSGAYRVEIRRQGFPQREVQVELGASTNLGEIRLDAIGPA